MTIGAARAAQPRERVRAGSGAKRRRTGQLGFTGPRTERRARQCQRRDWARGHDAFGGSAARGTSSAVATSGALGRPRSPHQTRLAHCSGDGGRQPTLQARNPAPVRARRARAGDRGPQNEKRGDARWRFIARGFSDHDH
jgi:hypothetical protein